jgi:Raf kinase inhibitor-like YbhB/YbcL family protein
MVRQPREISFVNAEFRVPNVEWGLIFIRRLALEIRHFLCTSPSMLITKLWQKLGTNDLVLSRLAARNDSTLDVASSAFADENPIPAKYSADGDNVSFPIAWSNQPDDTKSWAVMIEDPDAPFPKPFVHWLIYNIPAQLRSLPEGVPNDGVVMSMQGIAQGKNSKLEIGYTGPKPPKGDGEHHYHVEVYALDSFLNLGAGAGRADLESAMKGHVLSKGEIVGTYAR